MNDRSREYDIWINWLVNDVCNIDCSYCCRDMKLKRNNAIDIPNLVKTLDATGKTFKIHFSGGGEPFLVPNIIEACEAISENHFIGFCTNLTTHKITEFCERIDPKRVIGIHASLHIKELERLKLVDRYIDNVHLLKENGFVIKTVEVGHPDILKEAKHYKEFFEKRGVTLTFSYFAGIHEGKEYPLSYTKEELALIDDHYGKFTIDAFKSKGKLCNAGQSAARADSKGNVQSCDFINEDLGNLYTGLKLKEHLISCPLKTCPCPLQFIDSHVFEKAKKEQKGFVNRHVMPRYRGITASKKIVSWAKNRNLV